MYQILTNRKDSPSGTNQLRATGVSGPADKTINVVIVHECPLIREGIRLVLEQQKEMKIVGDTTEHEQLLALVGAIPQPDVVIFDGTLRSCQPAYSAAEVVAQVYKAGVHEIIVFASSTTPPEEELFLFMRSGAAAYELPTIPIDKLVEKIGRVANGEYLITSAALSQSSLENDPVVKVIWSSQDDTPGQMQPYNKAKPRQQFEASSCRGGDQKMASEPASSVRSKTSRANTTGITTREIKILRYFGQGFSNTQIAKELHIGEQVLKNTITDLFTKLHVQGRTHAVITAIRYQLLSLNDIGNEVLTAEEFAQRSHSHAQIARSAALRSNDGHLVPTSGAT
jgi:DNA-binding NarL/FixJ family response regulator